MRATAVIPIERTEITKRNSLGDMMEDERSPWEKTFYHRVIQTKIGEALRAQYDQKHKPLPHRFLTRLMQLDEQQNPDAAKAPSRATPLTQHGLSRASWMARLLC